MRRRHTGHATASVASGDTFVVKTAATGSQYGSRITGSIDVSGSIKAFSFIGDGSQLTNVQAAASPLIASGSATASVASGKVFQVITNAVSGGYYGAEFTGSVSISGSISASLYEGDGGGLFNIPASALKDLQLDRILSGSARAIIDPTKLDVNTPITAARYDGDGSGLFNIPALALTDLKLDRIKSGSAEAVISPNFGLVVNTKASISQSLSVSGGLFVTGGDAILASGSTYRGDGSGLTNITIANLSFETSLLKSGSFTASISPNNGFVINASASIWGDAYIDKNLRANSITASNYLFAPLVSGSFLGTYKFQGVGPTASAEYDILRYNESQGYYIPQPETSLVETVAFSNVSDLTIVHNLDI